MLFKIIPLNGLSSVSDAYGGLLTGDTSTGFTIVDSFHAPLENPTYANTTQIDTAYGGGAGTGYPNIFSGGATPVASGTSPASYGTVGPYSDSLGVMY
mmetsp:Transcript_52191/g.106397  ORF Transcript_52191/g.106397 Transcript_52191/m.106397 type:complete len:98 (-) Transcript_52191:199-492(-)